MKRVLIIIVNFNGSKYLPDLLGSIFSYMPKTVSQEIVIIDNNSTDKSVSYIESNYPQIKLFKQLKNVGFAQGNNIGLQYAIDNGFDYVMLLNQDTIVTEGYLDKLVAKIESDEIIAAVQPRLILHPQTDLVNSLGNVIHYLGFGYTFGHKIQRDKVQGTRDKINYCAGASVLIKVDALKKVGKFNNHFFMYHEDLDLGWRFQLLGYKNSIEADIVVYHKYEFSRSIKKYYYMERNRFLVIFQNYKIRTILLILPALIIMEIGLFIFSFKGGWWSQKIKVYLYFLNPINWHRLIKVRNKIQKNRIVLDKDIVKSFSGVISHQEIDNPIIEKIVNPVFNVYWQVVKKLIIW